MFGQILCAVNWRSLPPPFPPCRASLAHYSAEIEMQNEWCDLMPQEFCSVRLWLWSCDPLCSPINISTYLSTLFVCLSVGLSGNMLIFSWVPRTSWWGPVYRAGYYLGCSVLNYPSFVKNPWDWGSNMAASTPPFSYIDHLLIQPKTCYPGYLKWFLSQLPAWNDVCSLFHE